MVPVGANPRPLERVTVTVTLALIVTLTLTLIVTRRSWAESCVVYEDSANV